MCRYVIYPCGGLHEFNKCWYGPCKRHVKIAYCIDDKCVSQVFISICFRIHIQPGHPTHPSSLLNVSGALRSQTKARLTASCVAQADLLFAKEHTKQVRNSKITTQVGLTYDVLLNGNENGPEDSSKLPQKEDFQCKTEQTETVYNVSKL